MAHIDVAAKAGLARILPATILAEYAMRNELLPNLTTITHEASTLIPSGLVRLTIAEEDTLFDEGVVEYLCNLSLPDRVLGPEKSSVTKWTAKRTALATKTFQKLDETLAELDMHLTLRTYVAGHRLSAADLVLWATIRGNHVALSVAKKGYKNVLRWFEYVEYSAAWMSGIIAAISNATSDESKEGNDSTAKGTGYKGASYEIDLPQMDKPMVTRFPPEPSGYLHIGHAKAALLNDYFAHQRPGGTLICRFDDTNPTNESMEFQDAIIHDLKLMGIVCEKTSFSSDYFQVMYEYAIQLIQDGKAFADDSELGKGDEDRRNRLPSKRRGLSIEDTLAHFEEMKSGSEQGQRWCLRARIAYDSPNGTLRDPVIYRCNLTAHHRTGTTWKIYPTYDFCAPILDSIEGVTLALRTNEYRDRNVQYEWFQNALRLRKVDIWDFSRLNFIRTVLSKRKLTKIVNEGKVWGWDDPRMPTIRGITRRGMTVNAFREFILKQGPSRNVLNLEWGAFWALNKKYIDPSCPRHTAIIAKNAVRCTVAGIDAPGTLMKPRYHKNPELGMQKVLTAGSILLEQVDAAELTVGEEITLMNWGNAFVRDVTRMDAGGPITAVAFQLHLEGDVKKTKKVTWLADVPDNLIPVDVVSFDYLITKNKLEKSDTIEECLTPTTEFRDQAFADGNVAELQPGAMIQFERKGYYILDNLESCEVKRRSFFDIPSGKS